MHLPARMFRAEVNANDPGARDLSPRDRATRERIVERSAGVFAKYGVKTATFTTVAYGLTISTTTLRKHFVDIDTLLAEILRRHLMAIARAIGAVPRDAPDHAAARRAAYIAATRTPFGALNQAHLLFVRERHMIGDDELLPLEDMHRQFGIMLGGDQAEKALGMLDNPSFEAEEIDDLLAYAARRQAARANAIQPAPKTANSVAPPAETAEPPEPPAWLQAIRRRDIKPDPARDDLSHISGVYTAAGLTPGKLAQPP